MVSLSHNGLVIISVYVRIFSFVRRSSSMDSCYLIVSLCHGIGFP